MLKVLLINSLIIFIGAYLFKGVEVKNFLTAVGVALLLAIINTFIKPLIVLLTLPVTILTLGLFILVINAWILLLINRLVDGLKIDGFWWAVIYSIFISVMNAILFRIF